MSGNKGQNHFLHYLLIILFSSGLVALGANEIHRKYGRQIGFRARGKQLIEELKGDSPSSFSQVQSARSGQVSPSAKGSIRWDLIGGGQESWSGNSGKGNSPKLPAAEDKLSSSDRRELNALLSDIGSEQ